MSESQGIAQVAARKRLLVAQSEELRRQAVDDFLTLQSSCTWLERGYGLVQKGGRFWPLLAGAAGLMLARGGGSWLRTARRVWSWWELGKKGFQVATAVSRRKSDSPRSSARS